MDDLELVQVGLADCGVPDMGGLGENGFYDTIVGKEEGLFILSPCGSGDGLHDLEPAGGLS